MNKNEVFAAFRRGITAVIRIKETQLARIVSEEAVRSGMDLIELTLTIQDAPELIQEMKAKFPDKVIGAGTVLTTEDCERVIAKGADFVVSPCMEESVIRVCNEHGILCLPGAGTATEAYTGYKLGCPLIKVFPGDVLGPAFIKSIRAPMPFLECMPSGGVSEDNIADWLQAGAYAVSIGSALYQGVDASNLHLIGERVRRYFARL